MNPSIISLLPPFVLFVVACITHDVLKAFAAGIFVALLIVASGNPIVMMTLLCKQVYSYISDPNVIMLFLFLISIGALVTLLSNIKIKHASEKKHATSLSFIRSARMAEYTGALFSFLFSVDDYLSILTVGFLMTQLAEKYQIAKTRIAYFVHSLSGPLVILIPISSWAAEIISQLYQAGVHAKIGANTVIHSDPLFLYVKSMGYNFYSFLTIFSVLFFIQTQKQMGRETRSQSNQKRSEKKSSEASLPLFDIALPLSVLLLSTFVGLLYTGGFYLLGGENSLFDALKSNVSTFYVLCVSGCISLLVGFLYQWNQERVKIFDIFTCILGGFNLMKGAMAMVFLASIFGAFVRRDLLTGVYLANTLLSHISHAFIPLVTFLTSLLIAVMTGTAWGTFALMIPIVLQMLISASGHAGVVTAFDQIPFLLPSLGAIFSGGVCGDHLSLFSETTIMTGVATGISPVEHARTQLSYAIFALIATGILYLCIGIFPQSLAIPLPFFVGVGCVLCGAILFIVGRIWK